MDLVFSTISSMTGGLITDIQTVMVALLSISFICMAFDLIKDMLCRNISENRLYTDAKKTGFTEMDVQEDVTKAKYQRSLDRYKSRYL